MPSDPLSPTQRRSALRLGLIHGALWSGGNALTTGPLISFLALDLGAQGRQLGLLLALPAVAGLLRIFARAVIARSGTAKRACLGTLAAAYVVLLGLPLTGWIGAALPAPAALGLLMAVICVHQLLEYVGLVALWSWFADVVPLRIRGRYFARRQIVQLVVAIPVALIAGYFCDAWRDHHKADRSLTLLGYALPNALGAAVFLGSVIPLLLMPATRRIAPAAGIPWRAMAAPLRDLRFRRLISFRTWFSLANGISQSAQSAFPKAVLHLGTGDLAVMTTAMRLGQIGAARVVGPISDRYGNRPVLVAAQVCVSAAMIFYLVASPATPATAWLILGAWLLWSAYAAHNICLPNLALKLAPVEEKSGYVAAPEALASLAYAAASICGGFLLDWLVGLDGSSSASDTIEPYVVMFWIALVGRSLAVPLAVRIDEPAAWTWRRILATTAKRTSGDSSKALP